MAFGWAAGDLAVGGSTGSPDVAQSEDAGGVEARIPDAPVGARPRNGAATAPLSPTQLATLLGHQYPLTRICNRYSFGLAMGRVQSMGPRGLSPP